MNVNAKAILISLFMIFTLFAPLMSSYGVLSDAQNPVAQPYYSADWRQIWAGGFGEMLSIAVSQNSNKIAVCGSSVVHIINASTYELETQLLGHVAEVHSVSWLKNGTMIATGASDATVRLWNASTGEELKLFSGHTDMVLSVCSSPESEKIVSGDREGKIGVWNITSGENMIFIGHHDSVNALSYSPNGKYIVSCSGAYRSAGASLMSLNNTIKIWNAESFEEIMTIYGHSNGVTSVSYSPDSNRIASGSRDDTVKIWDAYTGEELKTLTDHTGDVNSVSWSPNGEMLASSSDDQTVRIWSAETDECICTISHPAAVTSVSWLDNSRVASGCGDYTFRIWDLNGNCIRAIAEHTSDVRCVDWSLDYTKVASSSTDGTIKIWDAETGKSIITIKVESATYFIDWSPDGAKIVSGHADSKIRIWNADTGGEINSWTGSDYGWVNCVKWSPNGEKIASASDDGIPPYLNGVKIWDANGNLLVSCRGHVYYVNSVDWAPDGTKIVSGSSERGIPNVRIWDADTGECLEAISASEDAINAVSWSPKNDKICSASWGVVKVWNTSGAYLKTLGGHDSWVYGLGWSPDGEKVVSSSKGEIKIWNPETGMIMSNIEGHDPGDESYYYVYSVVWSAENKIVSGSKDGTVRIWHPVLGISVNASTKLRSGEQMQMEITITYFEQVIPDADVYISAYQGSLSETTGKTDITGNFETVFYAPDTLHNTTITITITASKQGFEKSRTLISVCVYPKVLLLDTTLPAEISSGKTVTFNITLSDYVGPIQNANVSIYSDCGSVIPNAGLTNEVGNISVLLTAPKTYSKNTCVIMVNVTKDDYESKAIVMYIDIKPEKPPAQIPLSLLAFISSVFIIFAVVLILVFLHVRKNK